MFTRGMEVTLIWAKGGWTDYDGNAIDGGPSFGNVYVVEYVINQGGTLFLTFDEWPLEFWLAERFQPVVKPKQRQDAFTRMLEKAPKREEIDA